MKNSTALRAAGTIVLALALTIGAAACSSDKKDSSGTTTTTAAAAPTTSGVRPTGGLSKADVVQMQEWLDAVGCDVGANDGIIGPLTIASLKSFQQGAGLTVDGLYGPQTKSALSADAQAKKQVCVPPAPVPNPVGPTGAGAACTVAALNQSFGPDVWQAAKVEITGYGCDQGWAYIWANIVPNAQGYPTLSVTDVVAARNGAWVQQDRSKVCVAGVMPQDIYTGGCTSN